MTCEYCDRTAMAAVETVWPDGETPRTIFVCLTHARAISRKDDRP